MTIKHLYSEPPITRAHLAWTFGYIDTLFQFPEGRVNDVSLYVYINIIYKNISLMDIDFDRIFWFIWIYCYRLSGSLLGSDKEPGLVVTS